MTDSSDFAKFIGRAKDLGAYDAKVIDTSTVKTAAWVLLKCQFGCPNYGTNLCCPPRSPRPSETREALNDYSHALMVHFKDRGIAKKIMPTLEREIFLEGYYKAFSLYAGGRCSLCESCNLRQCIHSEQARPSMEAMGIDVYATARANGFPIAVVKDETCETNSFGLVLLE